MSIAIGLVVEALQLHLSLTPMLNVFLFVTARFKCLRIQLTCIIVGDCPPNAASTPPKAQAGD